MKTKICTKCKEEKIVSEFHKHSRHKDGFKSACKECKRKEYLINRKSNLEKSKQNYLQNLEAKRSYQRQYRWNNLEADKQRKKMYNTKNKEKIAEYQKEYSLKNKAKRNKLQKARYAEDINFKLRVNLRNRINAVLKGNSKSQTTLELLGCSLTELKQHLESQFTSGMNWDNCGIDGWEIDHIKPCASFDLSKKTEQRKCFHYTNLQPLWAKENRSKADKILT